MLQYPVLRIHRVAGGNLGVSVRSSLRKGLVAMSLRSKRRTEKSEACLVSWISFTDRRCLLECPCGLMEVIQYIVQQAVIDWRSAEDGRR